MNVLFSYFLITHVPLIEKIKTQTKNRVLKLHRIIKHLTQKFNIDRFVCKEAGFWDVIF
jgi:4-hydroxy-L-threonine phosphate dehydrogenase PdxA